MSTAEIQDVDTSDPALPRWSVADVHESLSARSFTDAMERAGAEVTRLQAAFDDHGIRVVESRPVTAEDGRAADAVITAYNEAADQLMELQATVHASVSTDSRDEHAQSLASELAVHSAAVMPLVARLAAWVDALGVDSLADVSEVVREHVGPLRRLAERAAHQMDEAEESLYAELMPSGTGAWARLQRDVTSQLSGVVQFPDGHAASMPMPAVRGLATHHDPAVRRAAYDTELRAWPTIATPVAAALNAIKGDANVVDRRRGWASPLDAALFANSVSRPTFEAMQAAVLDVLADFRRWMRAKAAIHGHRGHGHAAALPWWDLVAPLPDARTEVTWADGVEQVRGAFGSYGPHLAGLVDRAVGERWIDAGPRPGKSGGAFCMRFTGDRSLVLLNWSGSADSVRTLAHELGHAYHNVTLAQRTSLQRRLPMALAETASIFCETLMFESALEQASGSERLGLLDVDLQGANQVVVDIHSRFLFETEVFTRRQRRTLGVTELNELMLESQAAAYGDGLDQTTAHPYMWLLKSHYYGTHFYNWPYTYGLLFGLGLFAAYHTDPERFRVGYDDLLSRVGMDSAEELAAGFGLDVTDEAFWRASTDVLRSRIDEYERLAAAT